MARVQDALSTLRHMLCRGSEMDFARTRLTDTGQRWHRRPSVSRSARRIQQQPPHLAQEEWHKITTHLRSCAACREEVKLLGSFDFSRIQQWATATQPIDTTD